MLRCEGGVRDDRCDLKISDACYIISSDQNIFLGKNYGEHEHEREAAFAHWTNTTVHNL